MIAREIFRPTWAFRSALTILNARDTNRFRFGRATGTTSVMSFDKRLLECLLDVTESRSEAFEANNQLNDEDSLNCLKYMLLAKIASGDSADVQNILNGKQGLKYAGIDMDAMRTIARAHEKRSLEDFEKAVEAFSARKTIFGIGEAQQITFVHSRVVRRCVNQSTLGIIV